jgi:hypothetical protein
MGASMLPQKAKKSHPGHDERLNVPEIGKKDQPRSPKKERTVTKKSFRFFLLSSFSAQPLECFTLSSEDQKRLLVEASNTFRG